MASPVVVNIVNDGDLILDVTLEKKSTKTYGKPAHSQAKATTVRTLYRVSTKALTESSVYFSIIVKNRQFREAGLIIDGHSNLRAEGIDPSKADASRLPSIAILDDNEATQSAQHELAFRDMLLMLHDKPIETEHVFLYYVATVIIIADRFDCVAAVGQFINTNYKFRWPVTALKPFVDAQGRVTDVEQVLRQKMLVAYQLGLPVRLRHASRELITRGSSLWGPFTDKEDRIAAWWNLPEGLEHELQYRRDCILNTIASIPRHFLGIYSSQKQQCKMSYDSSPACDAFQLGQMFKFLTAKNLLFLVDFGPASVESIPDMSLVNLEEVIDLLKQFPNYQVDKHHSNCGPQVHIKPILDFLRCMLSSDIITITRANWKARRVDVTWDVPKDDDDALFTFSRGIATDQRLQHYGSLHSDRLAKRLFTAKRWNWTLET